MDLREFLELNMASRLREVEEKGVFLFYRTGATYRVDLFRLGSFYVEIWNNTIHGILMEVNAFSDESYLKPYLDQMSVPD